MSDVIPADLTTLLELQRCETIVTTAKRALIDGARALVEIHDGQLYLARAASWDDYIRDHCPIGMRQVWRWMAVARIIEQLPEDLRSHPRLPATERAYRVLSGIESADLRHAILRRAIADAGTTSTDADATRDGIGSQHILAAQRRLAEAASPADPSVKPMAESPAPVISDGGNADAAEPQQRRLSPTAAQRMLHDHIHRLRDIQRAIANFPRLRREAQDLERVIIQLQRLEAGAPWTTQHTTP